jgi:hypothetical protein
MGHTSTTGQESAAATTETILERATRILDSTKEERRPYGNRSARGGKERWLPADYRGAYWPCGS